MSEKLSIAELESEHTCLEDSGEVARHFVRDMKQEMLATRGIKYRAFLHGMEAMMAIGQLTLPQRKERTRFLKTYYAVMRYIDDIVDGDRPLPPRYDSPITFVQELMDWNEQHQQDASARQINVAQRLLAYCCQLGETFGADFHEETRDILRSLMFDAKRRNKQEVHPEKDLQPIFSSCGYQRDHQRMSEGIR